MADKKHKKRRKERKKDNDKDETELYKHYETFYEAAPPGFVRVEEAKPEDCIPDLPENEKARDFLSKAPTKGLWMPLGKEVKVMKCWRCKSYGHRTGDKECPMFVSGNRTSEKFRMAHEDPMHDFIVEKKKTEKEQRIEQLKALLEESTTSESDSSSSDSSTNSSESERRRKKKRKHSKQHKRKNKKTKYHSKESDSVSRKNKSRHNLPEHRKKERRER
ncbi:retinitis pigmentosa 9 protein homolog [Xenia sp. Carnegie-2017]|uniref:retinitis pigmentosa 9 protein homolog n=1 Tax=Xenia sp. Carnegie-2017 TaxID=2897299 RepID=UPI001F0388F0|nr:retinitis pigmentosa 9 protein homolog [Xenia sp. Carnegie-2017]